MKKSQKILIFVSLILMVTVVSIGYASISGNLSIFGNGAFTPAPFEGVYICDAKIISFNALTGYTFEYVHPTNFSTELTVAQSNASITYEITVHNNTNITYWYLGIDKMAEYGSNDLIGKNNGIFITTKDLNTDSSGLFDTSDWIPPQTKRTFYATYRFGPNATGSIKNLINFKFGLHMDAVQDEFLKILNDKVSENGYYYLSGVFDEKYAENQSKEIGNIGDDTEIFNRLFGSNIVIDVNGVPTPVTIMISRRNVDGKTETGDNYVGNGAPTGCEYTVYITTNSLDGSTATVHAVSYTCRDGVWYQVGELYEGTCSKKVYDAEGNMGFDVMSWDATAKVYQVTDDISYKVGYEQGTTYDKYDSIEELISNSDQEFYNAVNNNSGKLLKPVCNILYSYRHSNGQWIESENVTNKFNSGYDELKIAFEKIKPYCYIGNGAQEVKIQNANSLTRAELIQLLEAVQHTYDYYRAVNGV